MFLGHYGLAYALKRVEPRASLGTLFLSVALVDTMWGLFLLTGWEQARPFPGLTPVTPIEFTSYPLSHSLVAAFAWGLLAGGIAYTWPTRDTSRHHWLKALVIGAAVASHWFLDLIVHLPDLPLAGNDSHKLGLGLWKSLPGTLVAELAVFIGGFLLYLVWRRKKGRPGQGRAWFLAGLLLLIYAANLLSPPPENMKVVGAAALAGSLVLAGLAAWVDRAPARSRP
jgi:hypothetical protein